MYLGTLYPMISMGSTDNGSEFVKKVEPSLVLPNAVEYCRTLYKVKGFYSTQLGRTLLGSTFFMNSDPGDYFSRLNTLPIGRGNETDQSESSFAFLLTYQADFKEVLLERGGVLYHSCSL
jgi:hypothetical protein